MPRGDFIGFPRGDSAELRRGEGFDELRGDGLPPARLALSRLSADLAPDLAGI